MTFLYNPEIFDRLDRYKKEYSSHTYMEILLVEIRDDYEDTLKSLRKQRSKEFKVLVSACFVNIAFAVFNLFRVFL